MKELDKAESVFIEKNHMRMKTTFEDLYEFFKNLEKKAPWFVHADFDVFNPEEINNKKCALKSGLKIAEMRDLLALIQKQQKIVGISLLENTETRTDVLSKVVQTVQDLI